MYREPKATYDKLVLLTSSWSRLRPTKTFGGMTLEQFVEETRAVHEVRTQLAEAEARVLDLRQRRTTLDATASEHMKRIVRGVLADRDEGEDGELYAAMGFIRRSDRSSGLTRRRTKTPETPEGAVS